MLSQKRGSKNSKYKWGLGLVILMLFILTLFVSSVSATRLPTVDGDSGTWGTILNDFLNISHNGTGELRDDIVDGAQLADTITLDATLNFINNNFSINTSDFFVNSNTGNVGIGTTTPDSKLHTYGSGITTLEVQSTDNQARINFNSDISGGGDWIVGTGLSSSVFGSNSLFFWSTSEKMSLDVDGKLYIDGNVGIGTASPGEKLDINGSIRAVGSSVGEYPYFEGMITQGNEVPFAFWTDQSGNRKTGIYYSSEDKDGTESTDGQIVLKTGLGAGINEALRIDGNGNVGIGAQPLSKLHLQFGNDENGILIENTGGNGGDFELITGNVNSDIPNSFAIRLQGSSEYPFVIQNDGNVGIGTTSPNYPLQVNGTNGDISIFSEGNISATGFITRTSVFEGNKSKIFNYIKSSDDLKTNGKIDHSKFYGYFKWNTTETDFSRPVNKIIETEVFNETTNETTIVTEEITTYPYTIETEHSGVDIGKEIDVLREAVFKIIGMITGHEQRISDLEKENQLIKSELCKKDNTYLWCK